MTTKDIHLKLQLPVGSKLDRVLAVVRKRMKRQKFLSGPAEAHVHFVDDSDKSAHARKSDAMSSFMSVIAMLRSTFKK